MPKNRNGGSAAQFQLLLLLSLCFYCFFLSCHYITMPTFQSWVYNALLPFGTNPDFLERLKHQGNAISSLIMTSDPADSGACIEENRNRI
jgi:hypothetical protein